jgi:thiamine-phosphate pyrophosphorylase
MHPARPGNARAPRPWLFSDPVRLPDPRAAAACLPRGAGVVARGLAPAVLAGLARLARRRGLLLVVSQQGRAALALGAGLHLPDRAASRHLLPVLLARRAGAPGALLTLASHGGARAAARARRLRPDLVFLSPAFPTASHPGLRALGPHRWARAARRLPGPVAALGGAGPRSLRRLPRGVAGFGAIGGLLPQPVARPPQCLR